MSTTITYIDPQGRVNLGKLKLQIDRRIQKIMKTYTKHSYSYSCMHYKLNNNKPKEPNQKTQINPFENVKMTSSVTQPLKKSIPVPIKDEDKQCSDSKSDFDRRELEDNLDAKFFTKSTLIFEELLHFAPHVSRDISDKDCQQTIDHSISSYRIKQCKEIPIAMNAKRSAISYRGYQKITLSGLHHSEMKKSICLSCSSKYDKKQNGSRIEVSQKCKILNRQQVRNHLLLERRQSPNNKIRRNLLKRLNEKMLKINY